MIFRNLNRRLLSNQVAYSGEKIKIELPGLDGVLPGKCSIAIFTASRETVAAAGPFDDAWTVVVDTATVPMERVFNGKLANTALTFGLVVMDGGGVPVIGGQIIIVASPFPDELLPFDPQVLDPIIRTSDVLDLFIPGENVTIRQVGEKLEISSTGSSTGSGVDPAAAAKLKSDVNGANTIRALKTALTTFADNLVPKATKGK